MGAMNNDMPMASYLGHPLNPPLHLLFCSTPMADQQKMQSSACMQTNNSPVCGLAHGLCDKHLTASLFMNFTIACMQANDTPDTGREPNSQESQGWRVRLRNAAAGSVSTLSSRAAQAQSWIQDRLPSNDQSPDQSEAGAKLKRPAGIVPPYEPRKVPTGPVGRCKYE